MANFKQATLVGTKNGVNKDFTIPFTFKGDALIVSNNSPQTKVAAGGAVSQGEYTISGSTVTFGVAPESTDTLVVFALEA